MLFPFSSSCSYFKFLKEISCGRPARQKQLTNQNPITSHRTTSDRCSRTLSEKISGARRSQEPDPTAAVQSGQGLTFILAVAMEKWFSRYELICLKRIYKFQQEFITKLLQIYFIIRNDGFEEAQYNAIKCLESETE